MTHLTRDELVAWRDRQAGLDRDRVLAHLGSCRVCTAAFADLVRSAPADEPPGHFKAEDFVARGYAARRTSRPPMWSAALGSWKVWGGALATAAAVILVVTLGGPTIGGPDTRGSRIELTQPSVTAGQPVALAWTSGIQAPMFSVVVTDQAGIEVYRARVPGSPATLPPDVAAALRPGSTYGWTVTALDAGGQSITSAKGTFAVAGAGR
jgi:hypothetical protein